VARQISSKWFAATLEAFVTGCIVCIVASASASAIVLQCRCGLCRRCQGLSLVEEHVLLLGAACFALGGKDLAHHLIEPLLEQVALDAKKSVLSNQDILLRK